MKPSSKNEVMNGIVNAYIAQKALDKANNTHYADTWKILNGADDEIDASLKFDLSEVEWADIKTYLKANKIAFTLCLISYKDGHSQNSFVWYDDGHIYATEMNEIGSVTFHVVDNVNKEAIKPTDETSSSVLKMLLALENGGGGNGGGETTTKQVFKGGVDILDKPLDVESKATFGADVDVDGALTINSAKDLVTKDGTSFGGSSAVYEEALSEENGICPSEGFRERYNEGKSAGILLPNNTHATFIPIYDGSQDGYFVEYNINENDVYFRLQYYSAADNIISYDNPPLVFTLQNKLISGTNIKTINGNSLLGEGDIKVQNVLYRHTITIYEGNTQDGNSICFTTYTPSNTPIDSIQDLTASVDGSNKLANTDLECFGVSGTASALVFYNKIHVGTNLASTTLQKATGGSVALSSVYSSYTITDDVSLN